MRQHLNMDSTSRILNIAAVFYVVIQVYSSMTQFKFDAISITNLTNIPTCILYSTTARYASSMLVCATACSNEDWCYYFTLTSEDGLKQCIIAIPNYYTAVPYGYTKVSTIPTNTKEVYVKKTTMPYIYTDITMYQEEAYNFCRNNGRNLLRYHSQSDLDSVVNVLNNMPPLHVQLLTSGIKVSGSWKWMGTNDVIPSWMWAPTEPFGDGNCVTIFTSGGSRLGKLNDYPCRKFNFICTV